MMATGARRERLACRISDLHASTIIEQAKSLLSDRENRGACTDCHGQSPCRILRL